MFILSSRLGHSFEPIMSLGSWDGLMKRKKNWNSSKIRTCSTLYWIWVVSNRNQLSYLNHCIDFHIKIRLNNSCCKYWHEWDQYTGRSQEEHRQKMHEGICNLSYFTICPNACLCLLKPLIIAACVGQPWRGSNEETREIELHQRSWGGVDLPDHWRSSKCLQLSDGSDKRTKN